MADTNGAPYDQLKQAWIEAEQRGRSHLPVHAGTLDALLREHLRIRREAEHLHNVLRGPGLRTRDPEEILTSYPCASPTCPAEQCILGRRIEILEAALQAAIDLIPLVRQGIGQMHPDYTSRQTMIGIAQPKLERLEPL